MLIAALDADLVYDVMYVSLSFRKSIINCSLENLCEATVGAYVNPSPSNSCSYGSKVRELKLKTNGDLEPLLAFVDLIYGRVVGVAGVPCIVPVAVVS